MSNLRTITNFKSALKRGGARPNLFEVNMIYVKREIIWDHGAIL